MGSPTGFSGGWFCLALRRARGENGREAFATMRAGKPAWRLIPEAGIPGWHS